MSVGISERHDFENFKVFTNDDIFGSGTAGCYIYKLQVSISIRYDFNDIMQLDSTQELPKQTRQITCRYFDRDTAALCFLCVDISQSWAITTQLEINTVY